ncbi:MAG: HYR domain-containing protein [Bacteroidota bacterium]
MKKLILLLCLLGSLFYANAQYNLGGSAISLGGDCFRLTPALQGQAGSVWFQNKISLASDFIIESTVNLGSVDSPGADGLAFVLQPICNGIGGAGGGIGYFGISPSLAVELDTYQNADRFDPAEDHIGLMANGSVDHGGGGASVLQGYTTLSNLEDGVNRTMKIEWIANTQNLKVTLAGTELINYTGDIVNTIFGGNSNVFWGFTAATGSEHNNHTVCITSKSFTQEGSFVVTKPTCPNYDNGAIDLNPAGGIGPFTYVWSNGETTEDISDLTAGTYSVAVTDGNGCVSNFSILVEDEADIIPPMITCADDIAVDTDLGICGAVVSYETPVGTDNCLGSTTEQTEGLPPGSIFPVGTTTNTFVVTDAAGNTAVCSFDVTVTDNEAPIAKCKTATVTLASGTASISVADINDGSTDNCAIQSVTIPPTSFSCENIGENTVILTVTDIYGNVSTCSATVTVVGEIPTCAITAVPSNDTYTGGIPTNIYIGYGPQSVTLSPTVTGGGPYSYAWAGTGTLSCTNCEAPVFAPSTAGIYVFTLTVTNGNGCTTTCTITICVLDIVAKMGPDYVKKVYICHVPDGNPANAFTIEIAVDAVPAHINANHGDRLGKCNEAVCGSGRISAEFAEKKPASAEVNELTVRVSSNPTTNYFTLFIQSNEDSPVTLRIHNMIGKLMDNKLDVPLNKSFNVGENFNVGSYLAEILQGDKRKIIKLLKAN